MIKNNKGYFLLEYVVSFSVLILVSTLLMSLFFSANNYLLNLQNKIELYHQSIEIRNFIDNVVSNSSGVLEIKEDKVSKDIYFLLEYEYETNKEVLFTRKKIYSRKVTDKNVLTHPIYEIANCIDDFKFEVSDCGQIAKINLKLKKQNIVYETNFVTYIKNGESL